MVSVNQWLLLTAMLLFCIPSILSDQHPSSGRELRRVKIVSDVTLPPPPPPPQPETDDTSAQESDSTVRAVFLPTGYGIFGLGSRHFNPWGGKRNSENYIPFDSSETTVADKRQFAPWGGRKRSINGGDAFASPDSMEESLQESNESGSAFVAGKEPQYEIDSDLEDDRKRGFNSWGGKKRGGFNSWGGKRDGFEPWGGRKRGGFNSWGGRRSGFNSWGGRKKNAVFDSSPSMGRLDGNSNESPDYRRDITNAALLKRDFGPWGGKRDFGTWGGKRGFHSWGGKRHVSASSGTKRTSRLCNDDILRTDGLLGYDREPIIDVSGFYKYS